MKKISLTGAVAVLTLGVSTSSGAAETVNGGTIKFVGKVVDAGCVVNTTSENQIVELGQIKLSDLGSTTGTQAPGRTSFSIQLVGCDTSSVENAAITFNGVTATGNTKALVAGEGASAAMGVGIQIFDNKSEPLTFGTAASAVALIDGTNILPFQAGFISTQDKPTAGNADATATFTVTYS